MRCVDRLNPQFIGDKWLESVHGETFKRGFISNFLKPQSAARDSLVSYLVDTNVISELTSDRLKLGTIDLMVGADGLEPPTFAL